MRLTNVDPAGITSPCPPKHVFMTTDTLGGVWTYSVELCRAWNAEGVHVSLAAMGGAVDRERARELRGLPNVELFESAFRLEWMDDPWRDVDAAGEWLRLLADRQKPDLLHLNGYAHAAAGWNVPAVVVAHSCVLSWWAAAKGEAAPERYNEYRERVTAGIHAADLVIAPTAAILNEIARFYGEPANSMVIPNGRNAEAFPRGAKVNILFSSGRLWDEGKNIRALTKVAKKLAWPLYIAGDATGPSSRLAPSRGVTWLGRLSEVEIAPWYSRAAIYVHPAKYEPFGLSVLEAGLAGCALVLSDIPSLRENWDGAATFVPQDNERELAGAINNLIEDRHRLRAMQERAAVRARRFSVKAKARKYRDAYRRAAANYAQRIDKRQLRRAG